MSIVITTNITNSKFIYFYLYLLIVEGEHWEQTAFAQTLQ